ncbi:MAG TPA: YggS family pyridoxal phosphate-dependent enzyme [Bacteroidetes bacterium]|nr:YggS family pyridoxal phosphate-dependent enzyme [Bacteroidota bacterium]
MSIAENIDQINSNLHANIQLVAVSKTKPAELLMEAYRNGQRAFGENKVQEMVGKYEELPKDIEWHFIGHLQTNKVKQIADWIHLIHSVDSENVAAEIQKRAEKAKRTIDVLVEVNTSEEATKFGVKPTKAMELLKFVSQFPNININGLMTIGPFTEDKDASRDSFRILKSIFDEANNVIFIKKPMIELSMGMTHDYEIAIAEGSTMIRIGTAIFGSRTININ